MLYEPGTYIDLTSLNSGDHIAAQFDGSIDPELYTPGTKFLFGNPLKIIIPA
jgi:hypothetical protein